MSDPTIPGTPDDARHELPEDLPADSLHGAVFPAEPWVSLVTSVGLLLAVVAVIDTLLVVAQGWSLNARIGPLLRVGFAFGTNFNKDLIGWVGLLAAVILVAWPAFAGAATTVRQDRAAALTIALATACAAVIALASLLGVAANVKLYDLVGRTLASSVKRELLMFAFRRIATAGVVMFAGAWALRVRFPRTSTAEPVA
jgi:hypothetical protein